MPGVNLELLKKHVNADDFDADDDYLSHLLEVAGQTVIRSTCRTEEELCTLNGGKFPLMLDHAILLLAGHWYNQREAVASAQMQEVPYTLQALLKPFRKLSSR